MEGLQSKKALCLPPSFHSDLTTCFNFRLIVLISEKLF
jgi:hypothetical protein